MSVVLYTIFQEAVDMESVWQKHFLPQNMQINLEKHQGESVEIILWHTHTFSAAAEYPLASYQLIIVIKDAEAEPCPSMTSSPGRFA